jgi:hypothetical protein
VLKDVLTLCILISSFGQVVDIDMPNSLLEEQGRQMYATKLIELQVLTGTCICAYNIFTSSATLLHAFSKKISELYDGALACILKKNSRFSVGKYEASQGAGSGLVKR